MTAGPLTRLREICLALPEATEKPFGGHTDPTWRVRDKIFVMFNDAEHAGDDTSLWCKAPPGAKEVIVGGDPGRFFVPPYVGHNGWVGVRLDASIDWDLVTELVTDSYRMTAPKRLAGLLPSAKQQLEKGGPMRVNPKPDGYHTVTPYLVVPEAAEFIEFMKQALGATEIRRFPGPERRIMHAEMGLGDSVIMLGDAGGESRTWPAMIHLYVADCDASYRRALEAGATAVREPSDNPDGDRRGGVDDRWGNQWWFATHVEDVSPEEMQKRQAAMAQT